MDYFHEENEKKNYNFIWSLGEENNFLRFYSVKLKKIE